MRKVSILLIAVLMITAVSFADGADSAVDNYFNSKVIYTDLAGYEWAQEAIYHLANYGLIEDDMGKVYPQKYINRAEFTKLIIGAFGLYDHNADCNFSDVDKSSEYYPYIASAYELGIINGINDYEFGMEGYLLRQDMATIIYRTVEKYGNKFTERSELHFVDTCDIDDYAIEAVSALVGAQAVSGNLNYEFLPKNNANFAEACKILYYIILKNT